MVKQVGGRRLATEAGFLRRRAANHLPLPPLTVLTPIRRLATEAGFLRRRAANHVALSPLTFLSRTADVYPGRVAIVYDDWCALGREPAGGRPPALVQTWARTAERVSRLASALRLRFGVGRGDVVAVLSPNTPAFIEAHFGINAAGAVVNPLNTRLDAAALAYILTHCGARVLLADTAYASLATEALALLEPQLRWRWTDGPSI